MPEAVNYQFSPTVSASAFRLGKKGAPFPWTGNGRAYVHPLQHYFPSISYEKDSSSTDCE